MNGRYTLYGVAGRVQLRASADGLVAVTREVEVLSDSESDAFVRVSINAPGDISGPWTMTLSPAVSCPAGFPEIATGRTYEVRFTQTGPYLKVATSSPTLEVLNPDETTARSSAPRCGSPSSATPNTAAGAVPIRSTT